jgi:hypothetical protein
MRRGVNRRQAADGRPSAIDFSPVQGLNPEAKVCRPESERMPGPFFERHS